MVGFGEEGRTLCRYLLDLTLVEFAFCLLRPSVVGWGAVLAVGEAKGLRVPREGEVAERAEVGVEELRKVAGEVAGLLRCRYQPKFEEVNRKYSAQLGMVP